MMTALECWMADNKAGRRPINPKWEVERLVNRFNALLNGAVRLESEGKFEKAWSQFDLAVEVEAEINALLGK